ncbi:hypothetical protein A3L12_06230 [Thermococcus sp. P6]|uniref:undecaprenyl-diphosphate phosphatase n=1 Tax=Thermococcus sp. P6 TaxID=122420 RepID=UPI000B600C40|nr:undecaprenyl-diphosphate phosphatase [Thermococcus sp. P6]ASJ10925.1 hypothetical protein A3L12_06230 [Thermococcus sp. P6]
MNVLDYLTPAVSGVVVALSSLFPISPEGYSVLKSLEALTPACGDYIVSAYLGVTFALLFNFRNEIGSGSQRVLRGIPDPDMRYLLYSTVFTLLIGYPLLTNNGIPLSPRTADLINAVTGALILSLMGRPGRKTEWGEEEKTLVGSIVSGSLQGGALIGALSRSGLTFLGLLVTGIPVKKALKLSFLTAPTYFVLKLAFVGWQLKLPVPLLFTAFLTAFLTGMVTIKALFRAVDVLGERGFLILFGSLPVIVYLMEVIL